MQRTILLPIAVGTDLDTKGFAFTHLVARCTTGLARARAMARDLGPSEGNIQEDMFHNVKIHVDTTSNFIQFPYQSGVSLSEQCMQRMQR